MDSYQKHMKRLMNLYRQGQVAGSYDRFQVWAYDESLSLLDVISNEENRWKVIGEIGGDWTEMVEVASYFNGEQDGNVYYVGLVSNGYPLKPAYREIQDLAHYATLQSYVHMNFSTIEQMAFALLIGGDWDKWK